MNGTDLNLKCPVDFEIYPYKFFSLNGTLSEFPFADRSMSLIGGNIGVGIGTGTMVNFVTLGYHRISKPHNLPLILRK